MTRPDSIIPMQSSSPSESSDLTATSPAQTESEPSTTSQTLTRNQDLVLDLLRTQDEPLGAYTILDRLRGQGLRAPTQVYRALDRLRDLGLVHRVASLNAFIACNREDHSPHITVVVLCDHCGTARELPDDGIAADLIRNARSAGFHTHGGRIELHGLCARCDTAAREKEGVSRKT